MPRTDDDLLARLNALKPSSVAFTPTGPRSEDGGSQPQTVSDRLADRLKQLRAGVDEPIKPVASAPSKPEGPDPVPTQEDEKSDTAEPDPIRDWGNDEQDIEELLAQLGPEDQWELDPDDPKHINSLLNEAKAALPQDSEPAGDVSALLDEVDAQSPSKARDSDAFGETDREYDVGDDKRDDEEADEYVKRILAELEFEKTYGVEDDEDSNSQDLAKNTESDFPSTPSKAPDQHSELEARFSKLGLDLPSAPSTAPSTRAKTTAKTGSTSLKGAKSNLPTYSNEDIDSWCCICNEDGEVKCLGCDGDIYCRECWTEGHGDGPGQERGHRAVQYNRKGPAAAAA